MKHKLLMLFLTITMIFGFSLTAEAADTATINTGSEFIKMWNELDQAGLCGKTLKLMKDINLNDEITVKKSSCFNITVDLNGHNIYGTSDDADYIFRIPEGTSLTITDSSVKQTTLDTGGRIEIIVDDEDYEAYVYIEEGGNLTLQNGGFKGNRDEVVRMIVCEGTFTMNGGVISDNVVNRFWRYHINGAAVVVDDGHFIMNGGIIANNATNGDGGAVYVDSDVKPYAIEMHGGTIRNNQGMYGGGVCIDNGYSIFDGGTLCNNTVWARNTTTSDAEGFGNDLYVGYYAETGIFGGKFQAYQDSDSEASIGYRSPDRPVFSGSVRIKGFYVVGVAPGFVCENISCEPQNHAWVGFVEKGSVTGYLDENMTMYTSRTGKDYDTAMKHMSCFYIYATHNTDHVAKSSLAYDGTRITVFPQQGPYTYTIPVYRDSGEPMNPVTTNVIWDRINRIHTISSDYPINTGNVTIKVFDEDSSYNDVIELIGIPKRNENGEIYQTEYLYVLQNRIKKDGKTYIRQEYQTLIVQNPSCLLKVFDKEASDPDGVESTHLIGSVATINAGLPEDSNYFESWSLQAFYKDDMSWSEDSVPRRTYPSLSFLIPRVGSIYATANYAPHHSFTIDQDRDCTVYRVDGSEETKVTHAQKDGTKLKLTTEDPLFRAWIIKNAKTGTDITGELMSNRDSYKNGVTIELPSKNIIISYYQETNPDQTIDVISPMADLTVNGVKSFAGKYVVTVPRDQKLTFTLDRATIGEEAMLLSWSIKAHYGTDAPIEAVLNLGDDVPESFSFVLNELSGLTKGVVDPLGLTKIEIDATLITSGDPIYLEGQGKVSFDANGGTGEMATVENLYGLYALPNCTFTAPDDSKQFAGWAFRADGEIIADDYIWVGPDAEITLYALWEDKPLANCLIQFNANGGTGTMDDVMIAEGRYHLPECGFTAPEGKAFFAWSYDPEGDRIQEGSIRVEGDVLLYAIWADLPDEEPTEYTIEFVSGEETKTFIQDIIEPNQIVPYTLPGCLFEVPVGKEFAGWSRKENGSVIDKDYINLIGDTTLYTVWQEESADPTKGAELPNEIHDYGEWTNISLPNCTKYGFRQRICNTCGHIEYEKRKALGHDYEHIEQAAKVGITGRAYDVCSRCGEVINEMTLPALNPAATSITKLTAGKKAFTVKWKKKAYTGYQIRYSLKSSMASAKTVTIGKAATVSKKVAKLKAKKKYYVQIRTYKTVSGKKYYSKWSAKKAVKTK